MRPTLHPEYGRPRALLADAVRRGRLPRAIGLSGVLLSIGLGCAARQRDFESVVAALEVDRVRQGISQEQNAVLGQPIETLAARDPEKAEKSAWSGANRPAGEPQSKSPDGRGGSYLIYRYDQSPWIYHVDAAGKVIGWDIPLLGLTGRAATASAPDTAASADLVAGLDHTIGLPVTTLVGRGFSPMDRTPYPAGSEGRLYTFRTPDGYYLALQVKADGTVTDWSATVPGIARPLRAGGARAATPRRVAGGAKKAKTSERAARGDAAVKPSGTGGTSQSGEPSVPSGPGRTL